MSCPPCRRGARRDRIRVALRRPIRRRAHRCWHYIVGRTVVVRCWCPCNDVSPNFVPPVMAVDAFLAGLESK